MGVSSEKGHVQNVRILIILLIRKVIRAFDLNSYPDSIPYKSIAGHYRPVSFPDGPITARCRFIWNAYWVHSIVFNDFVRGQQSR